MKIVHLSTSDSGGAGIAASRIHLSLLDAGVESCFVSLFKYRNFPKSFSFVELFESDAGLFKRDSFFLKRVMWKFGLKHPYFDVRDKQLKGRVSGYDLFSIPQSVHDLSVLNTVQEADIIHLHWVAENFMDYQTFFPRTSGKKFVWTLHDMNPFTGGCHHADDSEGYRNDCANCPQLKGTIDTSLASRILKLKGESLSVLNDSQMQIVSPSEWMKHRAGQSKLFKRFRHAVIPNPVDKRIFFPRDRSESRIKLNLPPDKKLLLFVAKDVDNPRKGIQYLVDAINSMPDDQSLRICSVGKLDKGIIPENIHIDCGYVGDETRMAELYSAADLLVLPSLAENLPNTICESLMCGTPVIAFRVGGIPSIVNETNGILVTLKDSPALAAGIRDFVSGARTFDAKEISRNAIDKFSQEIVAQKYVNLYNNFI